MTAPQPKTYRCPCCRQEIAEPIGSKLPRLLGPMQQRIFDIVKSAKDGITTPAIMERIYGNRRDGGPTSHNIISVTISHINKRMGPHRLRIRSTMGPGAVYWLERE